MHHGSTVADLYCTGQLRSGRFYSLGSKQSFSVITANVEISEKFHQVCIANQIQASIPWSCNQTDLGMKEFN